MPSRPLLAPLFLAALSAMAVAGPVLNERCPVEPTELAVERHQTIYHGTTVSFCCADCITEFEKAPENYLEELTHMTFVEPPAERSEMQQKIDSVWNAGARFPGITLGLLVIAALLFARLFLGKIAPESGLATIARKATGTRSLTILGLAALGGEALSAHLAHSALRAATDETDLEHSIHYAVYQEYGDPPVPSRPDRQPTVSSVFYRGNDERNPALFNGGHYRTTTFYIDLCDDAGAAVAHGNVCAPDDLFLRVRFERAPGTPDFFWTPERMALIYATRDPGKFHGRFAALADAVAMVEAEAMQTWEFRYPLAGFAKSTPIESLRGIVYQCEKRFGDDDETVVGGRFHYAFQFDLRFADGNLTAESDIWMGALYRKRSLRIWEIPESQWLSTEPIPIIEGEQGTTDPRLLGIEGYTKDTN